MIQTICSMTVYWHVIIHFASLFMLLLTFILKRLLRNIFSPSSDSSCAQSETVWWKREWNWPKGWRTRWWENLWRCEQRELWTPEHKNKFQLTDYNLLFVLYLPHIILTSVTAMETLCYLLQVAVRQLLWKNNRLMLAWCFEVLVNLTWREKNYLPEFCFTLYLKESYLSC